MDVLKRLLRIFVLMDRGSGVRLRDLHLCLSIWRLVEHGVVSRYYVSDIQDRLNTFDDSWES